MSRFFTLEQAEQLLPEVDKALRELLDAKADYEEVQNNLRDLSRQITMMGGTQVNPQNVAGMNQRKEKSAQQLKDVFEKIQEIGCQIKDVEIGLVDFPTLYHGDEVCLCWKLGETGIRYWHGMTEGFRGRKAIDQEFLENHRGDSVS
ncbi:MAG: DUF2203 domain-containing protein [Bryobacteraceae bacterium]